MKKLKLPKLSRLSIRIKINACVIGILLISILLLAYLASKSYNYSQQYSSVLDNINMITEIKKDSYFVGGSIVADCNFGGSVKSSDYKERIDRMVVYLDAIEANIGEENQRNKHSFDQFKSDVLRFTSGYDVILEKCPETYSLDAINEAKKMQADSSFISTSAENLLAMEIPRSKAVNDQIQADFHSTFLFIMIATVITCVLSTIVILALLRSITIPIKKLQKQLASISEGDLTVSPLKVKAMDEVGQASTSFNTMKDNLSHIIRRVKTGTAELNTSVSSVNDSVNENVTGSQHISVAVSDMLTNLESQQMEIEHMMSISTVMDDISKQVVEDVQKIQSNANDANKNASDGMTKMLAYVDQMEEVNNSMEEMKAVFSTFGESTKQMSVILDSIIEISSQTNLLSLNASIEAARAGEMGKGFAVVATEIRNLADDSSMAATKIGEIIKAIEQDAENLSEKMNICLSQLDKSNRLTEETHTSFSVIQSGTNEVQKNIEQIMEKVSSLIAEINNTVASMDSLGASSEQNVTKINRINTIVDQEEENLSVVSDAMSKILQLAADLEHLSLKFTL